MTPPGWGEPPPRKSGAGLAIGLSVGGALFVLSLLGTFLYFLGDALAASEERRGTPPAEALPGHEPSVTVSPAPAGTDAEEDVRIAKCTVDPVIAWPAAQVVIVNGSGAAADYAVTVEFVDKDGTQVADGIVGVVGLGPGQTAKRKAQGLDEAPSGTKCRIADVHRTPAAG